MYGQRINFTGGRSKDTVILTNIDLQKLGYDPATANPLSCGEYGCAIMVARKADSQYVVVKFSDLHSFYVPQDWDGVIRKSEYDNAVVAHSHGLGPATRMLPRIGSRQYQPVTLLAHPLYIMEMDFAGTGLLSVPVQNRPASLLIELAAAQYVWAFKHGDLCSMAGGKKIPANMLYSVKDQKYKLVDFAFSAFPGYGYSITALRKQVIEEWRNLLKWDMAPTHPTYNNAVFGGLILSGDDLERKIVDKANAMIQATIPPSLPTVLPAAAPVAAPVAATNSNAVPPLVVQQPVALNAPPPTVVVKPVALPAKPAAADPFKAPVAAPRVLALKKLPPGNQKGFVYKQHADPVLAENYKKEYYTKKEIADVRAGKAVFPPGVYLGDSIKNFPGAKVAPSNDDDGSPPPVQQKAAAAVTFAVPMAVDAEAKKVQFDTAVAKTVNKKRKLVEEAVAQEDAKAKLAEMDAANKLEMAKEEAKKREAALMQANKLVEELKKESDAAQKEAEQFIAAREQWKIERQKLADQLKAEYNKAEGEMQQLEDVKKQLALLESARTDLSEKMAEKKTVNKAMADRLQAYESGYEAKAAEYAEAQKRHQKQVAELAKLQQLSAETAAKIQAARNEIVKKKQTAAQIPEFEAQIAQLDARVAQLNAERVDLENQIQTTEAQVQVMRVQAQQTSSELARILASQDDERKKFNDTINVNTNEIEQARIKIAQAEDEIALLNTQLDELQANLANLRGDQREMREAKTVVEQAIREKSEKLRERNAFFDRQKEAAELLYARIQEATDYLDELNSIYAQSKSSLDFLEASIEAADYQYEAQKAYHAEQNKKIDELEKEIAANEAKLTAAQQQAEQVAKRAAEAQVALNQAAQQKAAELAAAAQNLADKEEYAKKQMAVREAQIFETIENRRKEWDAANRESLEAAAAVEAAAVARLEEANKKMDEVQASVNVSAAKVGAVDVPPPPPPPPPPPSAPPSAPPSDGLLEAIDAAYEGLEVAEKAFVDFEFTDRDLANARKANDTKELQALAMVWTTEANIADAAIDKLRRAVNALSRKRFQLGQKTGAAWKEMPVLPSVFGVPLSVTRKYLKDAAAAIEGNDASRKGSEVDKLGRNAWALQRLRDDGSTADVINITINNGTTPVVTVEKKEAQDAAKPTPAKTPVEASVVEELPEEKAMLMYKEGAIKPATVNKKVFKSFEEKQAMKKAAVKNEAVHALQQKETFKYQSLNKAKQKITKWQKELENEPLEPEPPYLGDLAMNAVGAIGGAIKDAWVYYVDPADIAEKGDDADTILAKATGKK